MDNLVTLAITTTLDKRTAYCKFLSANDSGETGAHQSGILISKSAKGMLFTDKEIAENHILKKYARILWQNDFSTDCTFTWYESKNELRMTGFGKGFPFLRPECTGALFVLIKETDENYLGFIFNTDEDIQEFLSAFGLTPAETNRLIEPRHLDSDTKEKLAINAYIDKLGVDFPSSYEMSKAARFIYFQSHLNQNVAIANPDELLLGWTEEEYHLFKAIEDARYGSTVRKGFDTVEDFVATANQVLNRRKSRAGKSLEHHLASIFDENHLAYSAQAITEGNKKPDFLFPSAEAYHDISFSIDKLCTLAAKTTCKDRWRQILNEADRLKDKNKYLCTMQQGISAAQMDEMQAERVVLVVPKPFINFYPPSRQDRIWTIKQFICHVKDIES